MLLKIGDFVDFVVINAPRPAEEVFQYWNALVTVPGREEKASDLLSRFDFVCYTPHFAMLTKLPDGRRRWRKFMVFGGLIFVPEPCMRVNNRDEIFALAQVRVGIRKSEGAPALIGQADMDKIRKIEAKLNLPPEAKGTFIKRGDFVRFVDGPFRGVEGLVVDIASEARIRIEVPLFGCATPVWAPADEIEWTGLRHTGGGKAVKHP